VLKSFKWAVVLHEQFFGKTSFVLRIDKQDGVSGVFEQEYLLLGQSYSVNFIRRYGLPRVYLQGKISISLFLQTKPAYHIQQRQPITKLQVIEGQ